jgi:hypothetical protein
MRSMNFLQSLKEPALQLLALVSATFLAYTLNSPHYSKELPIIVSDIYQTLIYSYFGSDPNFVVPIISGIIYIPVRVVFAFLAWLLTAGSGYRGTYLSRPSNSPDHLNIFVVKRGVFSDTWHLKGERYSLSNPCHREGGWSSLGLELEHRKNARHYGELVYVYQGDIDTQKKVRDEFGYARVSLKEEGLEGLDGCGGYWIDIEHSKTADKDYKPDVNRSRYKKLSLKDRKVLKKGRSGFSPYWTYFHYPHKDIAEDFVKLGSSGPKELHLEQE